MARFYGSVEGQARTMATRRGSENSGLVAHIRGWNVGVRVVCEVDGQGRDVVRVYETGGSNSGSSGKLLAEVKEG